MLHYRSIKRNIIRRTKILFTNGPPPSSIQRASDAGGKEDILLSQVADVVTSLPVTRSRHFLLAATSVGRKLKLSHLNATTTAGRGRDGETQRRQGGPSRAPIYKYQKYVENSESC